jgi:hypothetical protein
MWKITLLLLAAAGIFGSWYGPIPNNPELKRGDYFILDGDFHVHTRFSDGFLSPFEVVILAKRKALDVVGLTEHNMVFPGKLARWFSNLIGGPIVLVGQEVTTRDHHLIAVGLEETVPPRIPLKDAIARVHAQGGMAIAAHPVSRFWKAFDPVAQELDGAEVVHPIALRGEGSGGDWRWGEMKEFFARYPHLTAIGSSDYHFFQALGVCRTLIFTREKTPAAVLAAMKAGRTVVVAPNGERFGDAELMALLDKDPLPPKVTGLNYEAENIFDAIIRVVAWLGVLALILLARKPHLARNNPNELV